MNRKQLQNMIKQNIIVITNRNKAFQNDTFIYNLLKGYLPSSIKLKSIKIILQKK